MAEKKKSEEGAEKHSASKPKKKHLHQIITTRAHDGSFGHEHVYKDHPHSPMSHPPVFAGTSQDMGDLQQHMEDHFGDGGGAGAGEENPVEEPAEGGPAGEPQE
jgi:hypothetical protein